MKVALIIEQMNPSLGGREKSTAQIASAIKARGCDVTVICQRAFWPESPVKIHTTGQMSLVNFAKQLMRTLRRDKFDVSHAMLPMPGADIYQPRGGTIPGQAEGSRRPKSSLGQTLSQLGRKLNAHRQQLAALERHVAHNRRVICLAGSEMVAGEFKNYYGRCENVRVVFNGVNVPKLDEPQQRAMRRELRNSLAISDKAVLLLSVAANFELKGVDYAVKALATWLGNSQVDGHLLAVGEPNFLWWKKRAESLGIGQRVHFLPHQEDIIPCYVAADAVILLSWYDACSRVVLEATRLGIASITTTYNGAAEILADGAGIVVESPRETKRIVKAMELLADPAVRKQCRHQCLTIADSLSMDRHVNELMEIYREVASS